MRYVTNEQRRRQTLFKPSLWAVASWLIFRVAYSLRIDSDVLVVRTLKISQPADGESLPDAASCGCMAVKTELGNRRRCGPDHQAGPREMVL